MDVVEADLQYRTAISRCRAGGARYPLLTEDEVASHMGQHRRRPKSRRPRPSAAVLLRRSRRYYSGARGEGVRRGALEQRHI